MIIRHARRTDADHVYDCFQEASISRADLEGKPKRGFYEYDLCFGDIVSRIESPFSLLMENDRTLVAYVLACPLAQYRVMVGDENSVKRYCDRFSKDVVYADQLFISDDYPACAVGRLVDSFEYLLRCENVPGVLTAIPERPWRNRSSTRFALHRGYRRTGHVQASGVQLGMFTKPFFLLDDPFDGLGDLRLYR